MISRFWHNFKQWLLSNETSLRSLELRPSLDIGFTPYPSLSKSRTFLFLAARLYIRIFRIPNTHPPLSSLRPFVVVVYFFLPFFVYFLLIFLFFRGHGCGTVAGVDTCGQYN